MWSLLSSWNPDQVNTSAGYVRHPVVDMVGMGYRGVIGTVKPHWKDYKRVIGTDKPHCKGYRRVIGTVKPHCKGYRYSETPL